MPLINLQTNLRDLKYGNDRPNGDSSNQPYLAKSFVQTGPNFTGGTLIAPVVGGGSINLPQVGGNSFNVGTIGGSYQLSPLAGALTQVGVTATGITVGALLGGPAGALIGGFAGIAIAAGPLQNLSGGGETQTFNLPQVGGNFNTPQMGGAFQLPQIGGNFNIPSTPDFLVRGGLSNPAYGFQDAFRLSSYFLDFKSPNGLFFSLKQNLLSRLSVRTEASANIFNDSLYVPTSTIAQAGVVGLGIYLNKQGLNPLRDRDSYRQAVQYDQYRDVEGGDYDDLTEHNRLVALHRLKILKDPDYDSVVNINGIIIDRNDEENLLEYVGGPNAILGIGKTKIKLHCGGTRNRISDPQDTDRDSIIFEKAERKKFKKFRPTSVAQF